MPVEPTEAQKPSICSILYGALLVVLLLLPLYGLRAQVDTPHRTTGSVTLSTGRKLAYTVEMGRIPIRDGASDEIKAYMFFVAYRVASREPRPITFLWNGGPGSPSAILHLQSIGPRRIDANGKVVDFQDTALASTDLIFVDAPGTGFSRIAKPEFAGQLYQTRGDVAAFTDFVRAWRLLFAAEASPLYLVGESWGGFRAAAVAHALEQRNIHVGGIVVISGRVGLPNAMPDPTLRALYNVQRAVIAQHYGKLAPDLMAKDPAALQAAVRDWTMSVYVPALQNLQSLDGAHRAEIARQLAHYVGLREEDVNRDTLMVTSTQFLKGLLANEHKTLATFDMTQTADKDLEGDPIAAERYLRKTLGYVTDLSYMNWTELSGFTPDGGPVQSPNAVWDYHEGFFQIPMRNDEIDKENERLIANGEPPRGADTPEAAKAMALDPNMKMLIVDGLYDSISSCASKQEIVRRQVPALQQRIQTRCYASGHMVYYEALSRAQFSADLQAFVK
ncbi:alpha/beta fold hydrolase [Flavisphingomonas formosensis]|uniref:alpha/beta fold hydrolase n=1 Tax=Flavisphingomonas formosensis TaxID=861534 RepID=UPI0012FBC09E|nr:alpha/beta fold hydrolase [Sphingomonas formosensis]